MGVRTRERYERIDYWGMCFELTGVCAGCRVDVAMPGALSTASCQCELRTSRTYVSE